MTTLVPWDAIIGPAALVSALITVVFFVQIGRKKYQRRMYEEGFMGWLAITFVLAVCYLVLRY